MADMYSPVGVVNTSDVTASRLQANAVDVAASAQDINLQLSQAKIQQGANTSAAQSVIDYVENWKKLNADMAIKAELAKSKNDGFNNAVDPTIQKTRDRVVNNIIEMQRLREEQDKAGANIFKRAALAHEVNKLQSEAAADSRTYNQLMALKNNETAQVNSEIDQLKASYNLQKEVLAADMGASKALADSVFQNAALARETSTYAAKSEMGVAANLYERNRQGLQDQQEAARQNLDARKVALAEKEVTFKEAQIDAQMKDVTTTHMLVVRGLSDTSENRALVQNWLAVQPDDVKRLEYDQSSKWAQTMDHAQQTGQSIDPYIGALSTATQGTVGDFEHFAKQNGNIEGLEAYLPTDEQINKRATEIGNAILATKSGSEETLASGMVVKKPPQLTATETAFAREQAYKELRKLPMTEQLANNKQSTEFDLSRHFSEAPDAYISQNSVLATASAILSDPKVAAKTSPNKLKLLNSTELQTALRGHPELFTGKGDGILAIADRLITDLSTVNVADPASGKTETASKTEVAQLVSELLTSTAVGNVKQVNPTLGSRVDSLRLATNGNFTTSLKFSTGSDQGLFFSRINPQAQKFAQLKETDISDPMSLLAAVEARRRAMEEARVRQDQKDMTKSVFKTAVPLPQVPAAYAAKELGSKAYDYLNK